MMKYRIKDYHEIKANVEKMKILAANGDGLNSYINYNLFFPKKQSKSYCFRTSRMCEKYSGRGAFTSIYLPDEGCINPRTSA